MEFQISPKNIHMRKISKLILRKDDLNPLFNIDKIVLPLSISYNTIRQDLFDDIVLRGLICLNLIKNYSIDEYWYIKRN